MELTHPVLIEGGRIRRILFDPWFTCGAVLVAGIIGLWLDRISPLAWQPVLGACAWIILAGLLALSTPRERCQTLIVVVAATFFEIVGSILWGAYIYRWENLPSFVPPGHGMVFLFGLRLVQTGLLRNHSTWVKAAATVGVLGWATLGLTVLPRLDVAGAIGAVILVAFIWRAKAGQIYAGVFFYVAFLEIYGVSIGTWSWMAEVPGTGIANGNPPSGIAGGYVFFDMVAIALTPFVLAATTLGVRRPRSTAGRPHRDLVGAHPPA